MDRFGYRLQGESSAGVEEQGGHRIEEQVIEHLCEGEWRLGAVASCPRHAHRGRALNLIPFDQRSNVILEGVAKTGQVSPKGTVAHREWFDGHVDAKASVRSVTAKLSEMRSER